MDMEEPKRPFTKIRKVGPFVVEAIGDDYPYFSKIIASALRKVTELPDFSEDSKIGIMSDFGGEHEGSTVLTYSFLIYAHNKIGPFESSVGELRRRHQIEDPYHEFEYKKLKHGPRQRAIPDFLKIVDNFVHGVIVTVAIDKKVVTVFDGNTPVWVSDQIAALGFGKWKPNEAEKVMRICHAAAAFLSVLTSEGQRVLWYCDDDSIHQNGHGHTADDTRQMSLKALGMYCAHQFDAIGTGVSFKDKSFLDDLLSVADLKAGIVSDLLTAQALEADNIPGGIGKQQVMRWVGTQSSHLTKLTIQVEKMATGEIGCGLVQFGPPEVGTVIGTEATSD